MNGAQIGAGFQQMCRIAVAQRVWRNMLAKARSLGCFPAGSHGSLVVTGTSPRQFFTVPGNRKVFGFIQRQYTRGVSQQLLTQWDIAIMTALRL